MIAVDGLVKRFGGFTALDGVSLSVPEGRLVALLGPSGSGKTTLLRVLAGLEAPDGGRVLLDGADADGLAARDRGIGFVFQHYALFRHMTVAANIGFGLKVRRQSRQAIAERVAHLLELVQLSGFGDRYPSQLSGGQRQRVALARALAVEPKLLLLDEPFGALDAQVRKDLRRRLRRIHDDTGITTVFVTHDQEEALELADEVVVMNRGRIEQVGSPRALYDHPATPFVYGFLGNVNRIGCTVEGGVARAFGWQAAAAGVPDGGAVVFVRPHDVAVGTGPVAARVAHVAVTGPLVRAELTLADGSGVEAEISREAHARLPLAAGDVTTIGFRKAAVFPHAGGRP